MTSDGHGNGGYVPNEAVAKMGAGDFVAACYLDTI